jgi:Do/DeqQ family serine protease
MMRRLTLLTFAFLFVLVGFVAGLVLTGRLRTADEAAAQAADARSTLAPSTAQSARNVGNPAAGGLPDLTGAAESAIPSVPNISSTQVVRTSNSPFANDPLWRDFFGFGDGPFGYRNRLQQSLGSGVIVSADGYVLTNNHVVGDAGAEVIVTLADKREMRAKIIGLDEPTDLAVLKIDARNLPVLAWGDSSKLRVAEWVLAIGNPFGILNQTVTLGIVSATSRSVNELSMYQDFIQTDAAINQGNSGGALINGRGQLVGINTAIFSQGGGSNGVGFAVPSNLAKHVMEELITYGEVRRGTISGIELYPMNADLAERFRAPNAKGLIVSEIEPRSDAYNAGLRRFDIVVSFDGVAIDDPSQFIRLLSAAKIGGTAALGVLRDGRQQTVKVPIGQSKARGTRRR